ncbi:beta strand repeat-containing protein, partial [Flavobacterium psychrotolerans]
MKLKLNLVFFIVLSFFSAQKTFSQCFQIESILVDACDNGLQPGNDEGFNEMVRFKVGTSSINANDLSVTWPSNSWQGITQNATTKSKVAALNIQIAAAGGCGKLIEPVGGVLPANAKVILVTSYNFSIASNVFGAITENIYIIFQDNAITTGGHFGNYGTAATRTLSMSFLGCSDTVSYDRSLLVNINGTSGGTSAEKNGASVNYTPSGSATYTNNGCSAPVEVFMVDAGTSQSACPGATITLSGSAQGQKSVLWSAPSGSFSDATSLTSTYTFDVSASGSVELTLTAINSCDVPKAVKVTMTVKPSVIPNFPTASTICSGSVAPVLNTTSPNGITGTWSPSTINNTIGGNYIFTPAAGQCAAPITYVVTVNNCGFSTFASAAWLYNCSVAQFYNITGSGVDLINPGSPAGSFITDFGSFVQNSGKFTFGGGELKTFKNTSANVCGATMYYNVHLKSDPAGTFTSLTLNFFSDCSGGAFNVGGGPCSSGDQKWQTVTSDLVDMTKLPLGSYVLEVYYEVKGSNISTTLCNETLTLNNGGANYRSSFSIQDIPVYASTNPITCSGSEGDITISGLSPSTGYTLTYTDDAVVVGPTSVTSNASGNIVISGLNAGSYSNFVLVGCGTFPNNTPIVLVDPVLTSSIAKTDNTICPSIPASCDGTATVAPAGSGLYSYKWDVAALGQTTATATGLCAGTYSVDIKDEATGCIITRNITVADNIVLPVINTLTAITPVCSGGNAVFNLSGTANATVTYAVSGGANQNVVLDSSGKATITVNAITLDTTIVLSQIDLGSCNATINNTATVILTAIQNAGTLSGVQSICSNGTTIFSSTQLGGTWSSSDTAIATVDAAGTVTPVAAGTATITYTMNGIGSCSAATAIRTVTITAAPNAGILNGVQAICSNGTTTFTSNGDLGGTWSSSDTLIATVDAAGIITPIALGTATITYTVTGTGVCSDATATRTVTVAVAPNAGTLSGVQTICSNGTTTFTSTQLGGTWSSSDTAIATVDVAGIVTPIAGGTATINYMLIGTGGCPDATATRTVTITAAPNAGILSGIQAICSNGTTTFNSNGDLGGAWSSSDALIATVNATGTVTPVAAGTATITYTMNGIGSCSAATAIRTVTITAAPNAGILSGVQTI